MKLQLLLLPFLTVITSITAIAIPNPGTAASHVSNRAPMEERQTVPDTDIGIRMGSIRVWTSNRNNRFQFRILGGIRIVSHIRALWEDNGVLMAQGFFADFIKRYDAILTGFNLDEKFLALYKDHPLAGIVGFQFEVRSKTLIQQYQGPDQLTWVGQCFDNTQEYYDTVVYTIRSYFETDNNKIRVEVYPVEDAFAIGSGGTLHELPMKRDEGTSTLEERQHICEWYDLTSMFHPDITWDPYAVIYGVPMCLTARSG